MALFDERNTMQLYETQIFVTAHPGQFANFFTAMVPFRRSTGAPQEASLSDVAWARKSGKNGLKRYKAYLSASQADELFEIARTLGTFALACGGNTVDVHFGQMLARPRVFVPNMPFSSLGRDRWAGGFEQGFYLDELYPTERQINMSIVAQDNAYRFVEEETGVRLVSLTDLLCCVVKIEAETLSERVLFRFNPDQCTQTFRLYGDVRPLPRRVIMEFWEGDESCFRYMADLGKSEVSCATPVPFFPTKVGYELFEFRDQGWILTQSQTHYLIRDINVNVDVKVGVVRVYTPDGDEMHDVVVTEPVRPSRRNGKEQPWLNAERERIQINEGRELRGMGSIFVPASGKAPMELRELIRTQIVGTARGTVRIWDAYLDSTLLADLALLSLRRPNVMIQLLLSEWKGEHADKVIDQPEEGGSPSSSVDSDPMEVVRRMPRCLSIVEYLAAEGREALKQHGNLEVRNWFRSGDHAFHDRFLIVDDSVWQLGSSLKDLGNYHTTVYRFDTELAKQVDREFGRAWEGEFGKLHPRGLEIFPELRWIKEGDGVGPV